jgi:hypothetical protein
VTAARPSAWSGGVPPPFGGAAHAGVVLRLAATVCAHRSAGRVARPTAEGRRRSNGAGTTGGRYFFAAA